MHRRQLDWDGCLNVRDLGGHETEDGRVTRFGRIVRADSVRRLSDSGWRAAVGYGVRTIVDLRFHEELEADPPGEIPVEVVHVPALPVLPQEVWSEIGAIGDAAPDPAAGTQAVYLELLERYPSGFAKAVAAVAAAPEGAVLVHCTAGKDRTGIATALLLRLARVPVAAVAADYALSERNLASLADPWIAEAPDDRERTRRRRISKTPARAMVGVLHELERRHGDAAGYLHAAGLSAWELERVHERLVG